MFSFFTRRPRCTWPLLLHSHVAALAESQFGLQRQDVVLRDKLYCAVHEWELRKACAKAWRPWQEHAWDCEDQATEVGQQLRKERITIRTGAGTAVGVLEARNDSGVMHAFVVWIDGGGSNPAFRVWDATTQSPAVKFTDPRFLIL